MTKKLEEFFIDVNASGYAHPRPEILWNFPNIIRDFPKRHVDRGLHESILYQSSQERQSRVLVILLYADIYRHEEPRNKNSRSLPVKE